MKIIKLDSNGFDHIFGMVLFVVIVAVAGVSYLVASHADPVNSSASAPVTGPVSGGSTKTGYTEIGKIKAAALYDVKVPPPTNEQPNMTIYACSENLGNIVIGSSTDYYSVLFKATLSNSLPFSIQSNWLDGLDLSTSSTQDNVLAYEHTLFSYTNHNWINTNDTFQKSVVMQTAGYIPSNTGYYIWANGAYGSATYTEISNHPSTNSLATCPQ
jgi:hypothetical protein